MQMNQNEIIILRNLANEYMEIASLPIQREKMELWKSFNRLDQTRPMVIIEQLPWNELNYDGSLTCVTKDPFLRRIENLFRQTIYKWKHFPVDMVVEPILTIPFCAFNSGDGLSIKEDTLAIDVSSDVISHNYINQLETEEDIEKIKDTEITLDCEKSQEWLETAQFIFDGIIPVRQAGGPGICYQIWDRISSLMNVENIYFDLIDRPEFIHKIVDRMTQSTFHGIQQMNELGLFDTSVCTCHCSRIYTDELLPDFGAGIGSDSYHSWAYCMAQLFTSVSPEITEEFEIPYVKQLANYFGMMYYGCCERLDDRLDIVQTIPNIRKISCSPYSVKENFAYNLKKDIIMSNKPTPAFLATPTFQTEVVGNDIKETCEIAKKHGVSVEFLLKDISTVNRQPERLVEWAKTTMNIVENY